METGGAGAHRTRNGKLTTDYTGFTDRAGRSGAPGGRAAVGGPSSTHALGTEQLPDPSPLRRPEGHPRQNGSRLLGLRRSLAKTYRPSQCPVRRWR